MIDVAAELRDLKIEFEPAGSKIKTLCPFHDDTTPSCSIDIKTQRFKCWSCKAVGDLVAFLARARKEKVHETRRYIQQKYGVNLEKTISPTLIEDCHAAIWEQKELLKQLTNRNVGPNQITQFRLGVQNNRITIPITNAANFYIDLRSYSPGAEANKFVSMKGYGGNHLFPYSQLKYDKLVLVGGEIKAIACIPTLNSAGYGVITGTAGEGVVEPHWVKLFEGKQLFVCMDVDEAGIKAAEKVCHFISNAVEAVYNILLPTNIEKGGPDDFLAAGGNLVALLDAAAPWVTEDKIIDEQPTKVTLPKAFSAKLSGKRVEFTGVIEAIGQNVYHVPKTVCINCDKQQDSCAACPTVFPSKDNKFTLHPESIFILETTGCSKSAMHFAVRDALSIPQSCSAWVHDVEDRYAVEDVRLSSELDITHRDTEREMQPAYVVRNEDDEPVFSNEAYQFTSRTWPSPKNQEAISVVSQYELVASTLESYTCEDPEKLQIFQPLEWTPESVREKLKKIYLDFEANVARIYHREELYLATDLAYHSPLLFEFDGQLQNGWLSALIIGDSSQGKSEVTKRLLEHYRLGEIVEAGATTPAGLLGGIDKIGGTHFVTWGTIPQHDKRLVVIEELSEADESLLGRMNDARSRGIVQLTKIKKARARARTRTIMISNPPHGRTISSYNYGIDAVKALVPQAQYVRRFDICVLVDKSEVDSKELQLYRPESEHVYTSELCHELVLWSWTIKDVRFENERLILERAVDLTEKFSEDVPLVDRGSMRIKLARLAAAIAARTYSRVDDHLLVRDCHVEFICEFLDKMYSKSTFGYADYSESQKQLDTLREPESVLAQVQTLPFPRDFVEGAIRSNNIDVQQLIDTTGLDRSEAQGLLSFLVRYRAVRRAAKSYYKTQEFTTYLKKWSENGVLKDPPSFLKDKADTL